MRKIAFLSLALFVAIPAISHAQSVDILWQGHTYTPPFYQGRALWSTQSMIELVAIPQGLGNPANLNYRWMRGNTVLGYTSGVGKNTISFVDSIISRPQTFTVEIFSDNGALLASRSVSVSPTSQAIAIYENDPLYGFLFHREVGAEYGMRGTEVTFATFPFFFSARNRSDNAVSYEWRTNTGVRDGTNSVTYRAPDNVTGASRVSVRTSVDRLVLQDMTRNFLVQFGQR